MFHGAGARVGEAIDKFYNICIKTSQEKQLSGKELLKYLKNEARVNGSSSNLQQPQHSTNDISESEILDDILELEEERKAIEGIMSWLLDGMPSNAPKNTQTSPLKQSQLSSAIAI